MPEFKEAIIHLNARFMELGRNVYAVRRETPGWFNAFKENGDVMAVVVVHDHLNDFVVCCKEIMLCYGRVTGSKKLRIIICLMAVTAQGLLN